MEFEWDKNKNLANTAKHGIGFMKASEVFDDADAVIIRSRAYPAEERYLAIGKVDGRMITVVFTIRGNRTRLISARRARARERKAYGN